MSDTHNTGHAIKTPSYKTEILMHFPHEIRSGWFPRSNITLHKFHELIHSAKRTDYAPSVARLDQFIESNPVIKYLIDDACAKNLNLVEDAKNNLDNPDTVQIPRIKDKETLLHGFNEIITPPTLREQRLSWTTFFSMGCWA